MRGHICAWQTLGVYFYRCLSLLVLTR